MDGIVIISILLLGGLLMRKVKGTNGMSDPVTSIENIRRGVKNGWYSAQLTRTADGKPAVLLSGKKTDGFYTQDIYPITEADWQTLRAEGYAVV